MDILDIGGYNLLNLSRKNILLGKNGCGKSYLLKKVEQALNSRSGFGLIKYLSPERSGLLQYDPGIEQNITQNIKWLSDTRRQNQANVFRQQSAAQFRRLELLTLREIEKTPELRANPGVTFDTIVSRINELLDRVYIDRADLAFQIFDRETKNPVHPKDISSGESELISLGIECLMFEKECQRDATNFLMIDSPDVHLHPDLQARFARFLDKLVGSEHIFILIATHSTALLGAMANDGNTRLAFMKYGNINILFNLVSDAFKKVLPVFGAHPLSNVFNQAPILLLEGEDDERVWQQAVRSSEGRIRLYPCAVDGLGRQNDFEQEVARILEAVYDDAIGYSLRDRDDSPFDIADEGPVRRMRLACHSAENLLLTNDVLEMQRVTWPEFQCQIRVWLEHNNEHPHYAHMKNFADGGFDRLNSDVKEIRNDLMGLMGSNKPWEVVVGQSIASFIKKPSNYSPNSLAAFLGPKVCQELLGIHQGQGDH